MKFTDSCPSNTVLERRSLRQVSELSRGSSGPSKAQMWPSARGTCDKNKQSLQQSFRHQSPTTHT